MPLLACLGFRYIRRLRLELALLAVGGLLVPDFIGFQNFKEGNRYGDNMGKFTTVSLLAMGILCGAYLASLANQRGMLKRSMLALCLMALMVCSVHWTGLVLWSQWCDTETNYFNQKPVSLSKSDHQVIAWLRRHAKADELVYRNRQLALGYAQWGGLAVSPGNVGRDHADLFGIPKGRVVARQRLLDELPADIEAFRTQGFRWLVEAEDDPPKLKESVEGWMRAGQATRMADFGSLQIISLSHVGAN
jgi:hypothetical protein